MARYRAERETIDGLDVIRLIDDEARMEAWVCPAAGHNCYRWRWAPSADWLELLAAPPSPRGLVEQPFMFGNPVLFPYPNRIRGARFRFQGREVVLDVNRPDEGCAIHGLVCQVPWTVEEVRVGPEEASVRATIRSQAHEAIVRQFPFPFELSLTYALRDGMLVQRAVARNAGASAMPMGYGIHPWFPAPLAAGGDRRDCVLRVPARARYELERCLPTGRLLPIDAESGLPQGAPLGSAVYDDLFTDFPAEVKERGAVFDPAAGVELTVEVGDGFPHAVIYAPLQRPIVCIEPYTCITDAFNLQAQGIEAGMITLAPGESWTGQIVFRAQRRPGGTAGAIREGNG